MLFRAGDDFGLMPKLFGAMTVAVAVSEEPIREGVSQLLRAGKHATSHAWAFAHDVRGVVHEQGDPGQAEGEKWRKAESGRSALGMNFSGSNRMTPSAFFPGRRPGAMEAGSRRPQSECNGNSLTSTGTLGMTRSVQHLV
jgi:hypothetical protein